MTIYVDMDGVLAKWDTSASVEDTHKKGYFERREPEEKMVSLVKTLRKLGIHVCILSAAYPNGYAVAEKSDWLDRFFDKTLDRIFVPYGGNKADYICGNSEDILIDDYYENLDTSNKLPLKKIKQVGKIILKKNKNKHFLPIILSSIFIAIITFLLNFSFFDPTRYAYDSIVRSDSRVYISEFNKLENFKSNDEYNLFSKEVINDFNLSYAFKDLISDCVINGKKVNAKYLGTIVIDDNLNDYEIVFTDYVLNRLNNKYSFDFSDYDSLINQ